MATGGPATCPIVVANKEVAEEVGRPLSCPADVDG
jgi:hypothetical protein